VFRCFYQWLIWRTAALKLTLWESTEWLSTLVAQTDDDWLLLLQTNRLDKRPNKVWRRGLRWIIDSTSVGICAPYFVSYVTCLMLCFLCFWRKESLPDITVNFETTDLFIKWYKNHVVPTYVCSFYCLPRATLVQTQILKFLRLKRTAIELRKNW
jgi:hypothetical protein